MQCHVSKLVGPVLLFLLLPVVQVLLIGRAQLGVGDSHGLAVGFLENSDAVGERQQAGLGRVVPAGPLTKSNFVARGWFSRRFGLAVVGRDDGSGRTISFGLDGELDRLR